MKRIAIFMAIGIAFLLGIAPLNSMTFNKKEEIKLEEKVSYINLTTPLIIDKGKYVNVVIRNASYYTIGNGIPILPVITKTFIFPLGTKINDIDLIFNVSKKNIDKKVMPSTPPSIFGMVKEKMNEKNITYPFSWYDYHIGVGLKNGKHVIFLSMKIYPVRYKPKLNEIDYSNKIKIVIKYEKGKAINFNSRYDLLIIAPSKFTSFLQPLINHKEKHGIKTKLLVVEDIYSNYNGRDKQEKIKYAIKDAIEQYGIKYVLLFGGMKRQSMKWWIPVRYSHLDDNSSWETGYLSDLYFADIYKYEDGKLVFDDWDSNGNGIFAEWNMMNKDILDLNPDVYIGRLPCRNEMEAKLMIDKIIEYEENAYGKSWFKKFITIGGDSFPDKEVGTDYIEGQVENQQAINFMDGFNATRIWVEGGDIQFTPENAENVLSQGEGFVYFSGHGNPASWATHPHNDFNTWIDFSLSDIKNLKNGNKLPVLVVGGCHNSQFNVSIFRIFKEGIWAYYLGEMAPECWGWQFIRNPNGGSIATIGNTGLGYGTIGDGPVDEIHDSEPDGIPDCIQYLDGWLETHFFEVYNHYGKDILGETWGNAITDYINKFPINWSMNWKDNPYTADLVNCKTVQEWVLFGDPSLKIGGYP